MGVRYSGSPISYVKTIRADSAANMIADLDSALVATGVSRTAVTGGWKYTLQSPDGLQMKLWIQDLGDATIFNSFVRFTPTSADEVRTGVIQLIVFGIGITYEVWTNGCQFFLAPVGDPGSISPITFACGVPALPVNVGAACTQGLADTAVTELWWTSSSGTGAFSFAANFRDCRYATGSFTVAYNGDIYLASGNSDAQRLGLAPLCTALNVDVSYRNPPASLKYGSDEPLRIDAFIEKFGQGYGQLWDAFLRTRDETIDSIFTYTETDAGGNSFTTSWVAWNNTVPSSPTAGGGTVLATLYLLKERPSAASTCNIAY